METEIKLTDKQIYVLKRMSEYAKIRTIAREMQTSESAITGHIHTLQRKFRTDNKYKMVIDAVLGGFIEYPNN